MNKPKAEKFDVMDTLSEHGMPAPMMNPTDQNFKNPIPDFFKKLFGKKEQK
jgi:hypothetical protein